MRECGTDPNWDIPFDPHERDLCNRCVQSLADDSLGQLANIIGEITERGEMYLNGTDRHGEYWVKGDLDEVWDKMHKFIEELGFGRELKPVVVSSAACDDESPHPDAY